MEIHQVDTSVGHGILHSVLSHDIKCQQLRQLQHEVLYELCLHAGIPSADLVIGERASLWPKKDTMVSHLIRYSQVHLNLIHCLCNTDGYVPFEGV